MQKDDLLVMVSAFRIFGLTTGVAVNFFQKDIWVDGRGQRVDAGLKNRADDQKYILTDEASRAKRAVSSTFLRRHTKIIAVPTALKVLCCTVSRKTYKVPSSGKRTLFRLQFCSNSAVSTSSSDTLFFCQVRQEIRICSFYDHKLGAFSLDSRNFA
jgi:hypothetical protein